MKMKPLFTLILSFLLICSLSFIAAAHTNNSYLYHPGPKTEAEEEEGRGMPEIERSFNLEFAQKYTDYFDFKQREKYSYKDLSDAAVYLTQLGKTTEALDLLEWLHKQHPKEHKIVANLATTFELRGQLDSAEIYLKKAMKTSPEKRKKSEWAQLKIINAKQKTKEDPNWILKNNVLDLKWDTSFYAGFPDSIYSTQQKDSIRLVRYKMYDNQFDTLWHIAMQVRDRVPYSTAPDLIIANVMRELGCYFAANLAVKDAYIAYKIGMYYDPENKFEIQKDLDKLMPFFKKYGLEESVLEEKFHPAQPFSDEHLQYLPQYRNELDMASFSLLWKAVAASVVLMIVFVKIALFKYQKK